MPWRARSPTSSSPPRSPRTTRSAAGLAGPDHLERPLDAALPGLLVLGFGDPAGVLLAVGEGHPLEGRPGLRVGRQGRRERPGHLDLARRRIEFDGHINLIPGRHARALAHLLV